MKLKPTLAVLGVVLLLAMLSVPLWRYQLIVSSRGYPGYRYDRITGQLQQWNTTYGVWEPSK